MTVNCAKTRDLGPTETKSAFRHDMNIYMAVAIGATLSRKDQPKLSSELLFPALKNMAARHSALVSLILHDNETDSYKLKIASTVDLAKNVVFHPKTDAASHQESITRQLSTQFQNISTVPPWLLWISPVDGCLKVTFFFHHSLFDGTSGKNFLLELRDELNKVTDLDNSSIFHVPESVVPLPSVETLLNLPESVADQIQKHSNTPPRLAQNVWAGSPCVDVSTGPLKTKAVLKQLTAHEIKALAAKCKTHNTSITALLTALILAALDEALVQEGVPQTDIQYSIPRNLRPLANHPEVSEASFGDIVTSVSLSHERTNSTKSIWDTAAAIRSQIIQEIAAGSDILSTALLTNETNFRKKYISRFGGPRGAALEVSTLLVDERPPVPGNSWYLHDFYFIQGANSDGSAVTMSAISYKGGALQLSIAWASEIVPDMIIHHISDLFSKEISSLV